MIISAGLLALGLWTAYVGVGLGALYLLAALLRDWKDGSLW